MRPACTVPGCRGEGELRPAAAAAAAQSTAPGCGWDLDAPSGPPRPSLQCNLCHTSWRSSWWEHLLQEEQLQEHRQEQRQEYHRHHAPIDQMLPDLQEHLQEAD